MNVFTMLNVCSYNFGPVVSTYLTLPVFFLFALYSVMASVQAVTRETAVSADRSGVVT